MMLRPTLYRNDNRDFWSDPFAGLEMFFPTFWEDDNSLEKSFCNFSTDVIEKDGEYVLQAELPGFNKEDIKVDLKNDVMTISSSHSEESKEEEGKKYLRRERRTSAYSRSFKVKNVKAEDIQASYNNGVLEVKFPKRDALPEEEVKKIEVK